MQYEHNVDTFELIESKLKAGQTISFTKNIETDRIVVTASQGTAFVFSELSLKDLTDCKVGYYVIQHEILGLLIELELEVERKKRNERKRT